MLEKEQRVGDLAGRAPVHQLLDEHPLVHRRPVGLRPPEALGLRADADEIGFEPIGDVDRYAFDLRGSAT